MIAIIRFNTVKVVVVIGTFAGWFFITPGIFTPVWSTFSVISFCFGWQLSASSIYLMFVPVHPNYQMIFELALSLIFVSNLLYFDIFVIDNQPR